MYVAADERDQIVKVFNSHVVTDADDAREIVTQLEEGLRDCATDKYAPTMGYVLRNQLYEFRAGQVNNASESRLNAEIRYHNGLWTFSYPVMRTANRALGRRVEFGFMYRQAALKRAVLYGFTDLIAYNIPSATLSEAISALEQTQPKHRTYRIVDFTGEEAPEDTLLTPEERERQLAKKARADRKVGRPAGRSAPLQLMSMDAILADFTL